MFGSKDAQSIHVIDTIEIEYSMSSTLDGFGGGTPDEQELHASSIKTKISLHQKVYPQHFVLGWYRVSSDENPTEEDLRVTHNAIQHYCADPLFLLVTSTTEEEESSNAEEKELPLHFFEIMVSKGMGFLEVEFEVETSEPERIAVEKVLTSQPLALSSPQHSSIDLHLNSLTQSLDALHARVEIVLDYLKNEPKPSLPMLRAIAAFVNQLPPSHQGAGFEDEFQAEYDDMLLSSYLAVLSKTVGVVQGYNDKFRLFTDTNKKGGRRGGG